MSDIANKIVADLVADIRVSRQLGHEWSMLDNETRGELIVRWTAVVQKHVADLEHDVDAGLPER